MAGHYAHIEDLILDDGYDGAQTAISILEAIVNNDIKRLDISLKWDGAPAVFVGIDPADQSFFVATKGIFAKTPRVFKSIDAINSSDMSKDLKLKLINVFKEASSMKLTNILHGDLLYTAPLSKEIIDNKLHYVFQPNTIVYAIDCASVHGKKVSSKKIAIAWHSAYTSPYTLKKLKPDALSIDLQDKNLNVKVICEFNKSEKAKVLKLLARAREALESIPIYKLNAFKCHQEELRLVYYPATYQAYINSSVRKSRDYMLDSNNYSKYLDLKLLKRCEAIISKQKRVKCLALYKSLASTARSDTLKALIRFQLLIIACKLIIINALNRNISTDIKAFKRVDNKLVATNHEGYVVRYNGTITKLVNRSEFSNLNFNTVKPWSKGNQKHIVLVYGRFNPPTKAHGMLIDYASALAKNSQLRIYISHSCDSKRNPLPVDLKYTYMKHMFPSVSENIRICSKKNLRTLLDILTSLYNEGYRSITLVVGSDRYSDMSQLIAQYNGRTDSHGYYKFDYNVVVAGQRNASEKGIPGISSTIARKFVRQRDFESFRYCMPIGCKHVKALYNDLCKYLH